MGNSLLAGTGASRGSCTPSRARCEHPREGIYLGSSMFVHKLNSKGVPERERVASNEWGRIVAPPGNQTRNRREACRYV